MLDFVAAHPGAIAQPQRRAATGPLPHLGAA
jgi:hypothetical protein